MKTNETQGGHMLKDTLFARIESEKVCPRPKYVFWGKECSFWVLWLLAVVIGALAFAVTMLVMLHSQYALYEATHENFFTFMVEALPYLWIFVLGLVTIGAVYNVRNTKRGYRYPVWMIVASSIVCSFAGGSALHYFGFGYKVDQMIGQHLGMYMSQEKLERALWQAPEEGRLLGHLVYSTVAPSSTVVFEDETGERWRVDMTDLAESDMTLLHSEKTVKLLGMIESKDAKVFHACGAFPWMMSPEVTVEEMSEERQNFIARLSRHVGAVDEERETEELVTFKSEKDEVVAEVETEVAVLRSRSQCAEIDAVKRMPKPN